MAPASTTASTARPVPSFSVMKRAMTSTAPLSSISLPNRAPSRNSGKNCARNRAALTMKVCVQWASSGSPEVAAATSAAAGANKSMLQPRNDSQMSRPSARRMPASPIGNQTWSSKASMIERRAHAEIRGVDRQELFCRAAALIAQHGQEFPLGVELRGGAKVRDHISLRRGECASRPSERPHCCLDRIPGGAPRSSAALSAMSH